VVLKFRNRPRGSSQRQRHQAGNQHHKRRGLRV
jgi:hypothetical protein